MGDPDDHARGVKGVWDAVDTSPDLGIQNILKNLSKWLFDVTGGRHERN